MINDKVTELYNKSPKNFHKSFIENNNVLSRNKKGRRIIKIFRWIFNDTKLQNNYKDDFYIDLKKADILLKSIGYNLQIYYDVLNGYSSINDRPICPICGSRKYFRRFYEGYLCPNGRLCSSKIRKLNQEQRLNFVLENEKDQFSLFVSRNPKKGIKYNLSDYYNKKDRTYILFSWITNEKNDKFIKSNVINEILLKYGFTFQIYYDVIVLGLTDICQRPKCKICGNYLKFISKGHSFRYLSACSEECKSQLNLNRSNKYLSGIYKSTILNKNLGYDSSWELDFIKYGEYLLKKNLILKFDRCSDKIQYFNDEDKKFHYYYPDFEIILLNNKRIVLELKPANLVKKSREVFNKKIYAQKYYWKQKAKYIILTEKELYKTPKGGFFRIFDYI